MDTQDLIAKLKAWYKREPWPSDKEKRASWNNEFNRILSQANQECGRAERYPNGYCRICGKHEGTHFKPCKMLTSSINNKCPNKAPTYAAESPLKSPNPPTQDLPAPVPSEVHAQLGDVLQWADNHGYTKAADWITTMQGKTFSEPAPTSQEGLKDVDKGNNKKG